MNGISLVPSITKAPILDDDNNNNKPMRVHIQAVILTKHLCKTDMFIVAIAIVVS